MDGSSPSQLAWSDRKHLPVAVADFTGDGHADLVLRRSGGLFLRAGRGDGTFAVARRILTQAEAQNMGDAVAGRFTSGDELDLAFILKAGQYDGRLVLLVNDGSGRFTLRPDTRVWESIRSLSAARFDGDSGRASLLLVFYNYQARDYQLIGAKFGDHGALPVTRVLATGPELSYQPPRLVDLNGDGTDDLMIPRTIPGGGGTMQGLISTGRGGLRGITIGSMQGSLESVMAGDVTGDGIPDVVATTFGYGAQDGRDAAFGGVLLIEGRRNQSGQLIYLPARRIYQEVFFNEDEPRLFLIGLGNTDGDSRPDLVIERANVFFNDPTTSTTLLLEHDDAADTGFSLRTPIPDRRGGSVFGAVGYSTADVDGDGRLEIFQRTPDGIRLWWTLPS